MTCGGPSAPPWPSPEEGHTQLGNSNPMFPIGRPQLGPQFGAFKHSQAVPFPSWTPAFLVSLWD
eukprot:1150706-Pelagomonas_calceolata.AAC.6